MLLDKELIAHLVLLKISLSHLESSSTFKRGLFVTLYYVAYEYQLETHSSDLCAARVSFDNNFPAASPPVLGVLLACSQRSVGARRSYALCGDGPSSEVLTAREVLLERSSLRRSSPGPSPNLESNFPL